LQLLKIRAKRPKNEFYDMFPMHDYIRIDSNVHGLPNHPAPQMNHSFAAISNQPVIETGPKTKRDVKSVVVRDIDGTVIDNEDLQRDKKK